MRPKIRSEVYVSNKSAFKLLRSFSSFTGGSQLNVELNAGRPDPSRVGAGKRCQQLLQAKLTSTQNYHPCDFSKNALTCHSFHKKVQIDVIPEEQRKMAKDLKFSDYDWIGFDLDNTLGEYQLLENVKLEFDLMAKFLVDQKGYDSSILSKPFEDDIDFLLRGLMLDNFRGNVLKIGYDGTVLRACHGTKPISDEEVTKVYGDDRKWDLAGKYCSDPLSLWEGSEAEKLRPLLDYFDTPVSLLFARAVDAVDNKLGKRPDKYTVWPDILEGLCLLYSREHFQLNKGGYFPALKSDPQKYVKKCSPQVLEWLKDLKKTKKLFVITGSNVDYASFTATQALGENWRDYVDITIFYSRKPGFFTGNRPFLKIEENTETDFTVTSESLQLNNGYSQGNWKELYKFMGRISKKEEPKCLYVGDNLIQDILTPSKHTNCDAIALSEELCAESDPKENPTSRHRAESMLTSNFWGSYFYDEKLNKPTLWSKIIKQHSKVCIPNMEALTRVPSDHPFKCFTPDSAAENIVSDISGYFPFSPTTLHKKNKVNSSLK